MQFCIPHVFTDLAISLRKTSPSQSFISTKVFSALALKSWMTPDDTERMSPIRAFAADATQVCKLLLLPVIKTFILTANVLDLVHLCLSFHYQCAMLWATSNISDRKFPVNMET